MFNTKTIMAHVFLFFTIFAHAQKQENVNKDVTFSGINFKTQEVIIRFPKKKLIRLLLNNIRIRFLNILDLDVMEMNLR